MRIMMLGWEFPPFIAGGLGTACYGLTKALDRQGHQVVFILPKPVDRSHSSHIRLLSPEAIRAMQWAPGEPVPKGTNGFVRLPSGEIVPAGPVGVEHAGAMSYTMAGLGNVLFHALPAGFSSPYPSFETDAQRHAIAGAAAAAHEHLGVLEHVDDPAADGRSLGEAAALEAAMGGGGGGGGGGHHAPPAHESAAKGGAGAAYEGDMIVNAARYARLVVALARNEKFDVIHAHDWMTFPAGLALARVARKPLVIHVHSTEFDRAGEHVHQRVYDIERRGMHGAARIIAVSELTKSICVHRYGVDAAKIDVVYNGIESDAVQPTPGVGIAKKDKIVLFLGRLTMQKGPEYFIRAAKRVLEKVPEAKFVVAGSGDMAVKMIEEAAWLGIGHRVLFTGFVRGKQVDQVYRMADCYVMPSVSEPFGLAPLEAMRNDVPVIISKQSGVSEVLTHALKVDFWDIDEMANKIVAVLRHPPLGATLREHGAFEVRRLTWDGAAAKCVEAYQAAAG